ncbi:MAG: alanine-tRNA synthetase second additional domain-containing protein [Peptococcaceae bacterium]|nr:alanine-tRNA synthetase second additional domain-containing protein [Peptococcaceae bacterium]
MPYSHKMQKSHLYSVFYAPRGRQRIYELGIQLSQLYLSPFDHIIGIVGEPGSGKSMLIKGMFPGLELTNDDNGVNIRPLPLLEQDQENLFFVPHTYHVDIRFETGFTQMQTLADAIMEAVRRDKRVIVEHFDLVYPFLPRNADLLLGIGEEVIITRPGLFGPDPRDLYEKVSKSLAMRLMAHTAEDLCEKFMPPEELARCKHDDVKHGFILAFEDKEPEIDLAELEAKVKESIAQDLPICYLDEEHITIDGEPHLCTGPRTHVPRTGMIKGFRLLQHFIHDERNDRYLMVGLVGEDSQSRLDIISM